MDHSHRIPHIGCGSHDSVNAHMAHSADHHDLLDAMSIELAFKIGVSKGVDVVFDDYRFTCGGGYFRLDLYPGRSFNEDRRVAVVKLMTNVEYRTIRAASMRYDARGVGDSCLNAGQGNFPVGRYSFCKSTTIRPCFMLTLLVSI